MNQHFSAQIVKESDGIVTVKVGFVLPETNQVIVPEAISALAALRLVGGDGICFTGAASLPVAMAMAHAVAHLFGFVACFDPKLSAYVVAISHDPAYKPGQLLFQDENSHLS
jgi:CRISPR-associated protein Csx3